MANRKGKIMNGFIPNSFQVPNALVDEIISTINPNSLKCYLVVIRKTVGWQKEWDKISTSQLMKLTGIKRKDTIFKSMKELEELGLIESKKELGKLTSYRLVLKNRTGTKKQDESGTKKPYPTKDNNKKQSKYDLFIEYLESKCKYKSKVTKTKDGKELFNQIEDKKQLAIDYIKHQEKEGNYAKRITAFMKDYETVYKNNKPKANVKTLVINGREYEEL